MGESISQVGTIVGICGAFGGFLAWLLTGILSNKKDTISNAINIAHLNEKLKELEEEVDRNRREFEHWKDSKSKNY